MQKDYLLLEGLPVPTFLFFPTAALSLFSGALLCTLRSADLSWPLFLWAHSTASTSRQAGPKFSKSYLFAFVLFFELGYRDVLLVDIFSDERQIEEFHFFTDLVAHTELILLNKNRTAALDGGIDIISRLT